MTPEVLAEQAGVLESAAKASPMGVYAGMLTVRAKEIREVIRSMDQAVDDGWRCDIVPACGLEPGVPIYSRSVGPATVLRVVKNGMGIEVETDEVSGDPVRWLNPLSPTSPVVVLNGQHPELEDDDDGTDPGDEVLNDHARYGLSDT